MSKTKDQFRLPIHIVFKVFFCTLFCVFFVVVFFGFAGKFDWFRGWIYVIILSCGQGCSAFYIWKKNPELLKRRGEAGKGVKKWDKIVLGLFGLLYCTILIVAALDERYSWSTMSVKLWLVGAIMYAFFVVVLTWTMVTNPHFEKFVRIQYDRDHRVIDTGPYRIVRHPGYLATILGFILAVPFLLGSWWAFIPVFLAAACLIIRTALEDSTLRNELSGYEDYVRRVRYRLLPGIW